MNARSWFLGASALGLVTVTFLLLRGPGSDDRHQPLGSNPGEVFVDSTKVLAEGDRLSARDAEPHGLDLAAPEEEWSRASNAPPGGDGRLDVLVAASEDGRPLEQVLVTVRLDPDSAAGSPEERRAWTNGEGRVDLAVPAGQALRLTAGRAPSMPDWPTSSSERDVPALASGEVREVRLSLSTAEATVWLHGRVVDAEEGGPLGDASVSLVPVGVEALLVPIEMRRLGWDESEEAAAVAFTTADGRFSLGFDTWKDCVLAVQHDARGVVVVGPDALSRDQAAPREVVLAPAAVLEGCAASLSTAAGRLRAIAAVELTGVVLLAEGDQRALPVRMKWWCLLDEHGRFRLDELPPRVLAEVSVDQPADTLLWRTTIRTPKAGESFDVGPDPVRSEAR